MDLKNILGKNWKDDITVDELLELVADIDEGVSQSEYNKIKDKADKSAKEAADWKKQYRDSLGAVEQKAQEDKETLEKLMAENEMLKKEKYISENTESLMELGYSKELAADTAKAMAEGDTKKIFSNQAKFIESVRGEQAKKDLNDTKTPDQVGSEGQDTMTKEKFQKLSLQEKQEIFTNDRALFDSMTK